MRTPQAPDSDSHSGHFAVVRCKQRPRCHLVRHYFLFITNKLNAILNNRNVTDQAIALTALQRLITMLRQHVGQYVPNVMATLQRVRGAPQLAHAGMFVTRCAVRYSQCKTRSSRSTRARCTSLS